MRVDNLNHGEMKDVLRRLAALERATPLNNASIGRNGLRVHSGGVITIENGGLSITGTAEVIGQLLGTGVLAWMGDAAFSGDVDLIGTVTVTGPMNVLGDVDITKTLDITGLMRLFDSMTVEPGGTILVKGTNPMTLGVVGGAAGISFSTGGKLISTPGGIVMDGAGGGGRVYAAADSTGMYVGANSVLVSETQTTVEGFASLTGGLDVIGSKNFKMEHPTKPGSWLRHGSTESPVSGIEYWGDATLDPEGTATVRLPEYFEALAKPEGRTIFVTGRGFAADWSDINEGSFTVSGQPLGRLSWLVKAERHGGDFLLEESIDEATA